MIHSVSFMDFGSRLSAYYCLLLPASGCRLLLQNFELYGEITLLEIIQYKSTSRPSASLCSLSGNMFWDDFSFICERVILIESYIAVSRRNAVSFTCFLCLFCPTDTLKRIDSIWYWNCSRRVCCIQFWWMGTGASGSCRVSSKWSTAESERHLERSWRWNIRFNCWVQRQSLPTHTEESVLKSRESEKNLRRWDKSKVKCD